MSLASDIDERVICSTISFRHHPLDEALQHIAELGFAAIDLGALPGVCEHVPTNLTPAAVEAVAAACARHDLAVASINADVGDANAPADTGNRRHRQGRLASLLQLSDAVGAPAIVLPCGSTGHEPVTDLNIDLDRSAATLREAAEHTQEAGVELWVEAQHSGRLCHSTERAADLLTRLDGSGVGVVMDLSHIVASGDDVGAFIDTFGPHIRHVHVRDAVPGDIHLSVGNGDVDFAAALSALRAQGYAGRYSLELETRDVTEDERPTATLHAGLHITDLLRSDDWKGAR